MADIFAEHVAHREKSCPGKCLGAELVQLRSLSKKLLILKPTIQSFQKMSRTNIFQIKELFSNDFCHRWQQLLFDKVILVLIGQVPLAATSPVSTIVFF